MGRIALCLSLFLSATSLSVRADEAADYRAELKAKIEKQKRFPKDSLGRNESGLVIVRFRIDQNGNLLDLKIHQSSCLLALDQAATEAVRQAAPFPPIPMSLNEMSMTFLLPVRFVARGVAEAAKEEMLRKDCLA